ncbi:MAG: DUF4142 domain-containing protein [Pseudomonadota bacterium]
MKLHPTRSKLAAAMFALSFAAGTAMAQDTPTRADPAPAPRAAPATPATPASPATPAKPVAKTQAGAVSTAALTDGQILNVVKTLNDAGIEQANEAIDQAESAEVKQLAEAIKADHEASNDQIEKLLDGPLDLDESELSESLAATTEKTHERLQDLEGAEYDCAYLQHTADTHKSAAATVTSQLSTSAKDPAVKQFVTGLASKHQGHEKQVKTSLGKMPACSSLSKR